jgi:molybdopterin synthase catalytic subunit
MTLEHYPGMTERALAEIEARGQGALAVGGEPDRAPPSGGWSRATDIVLVITPPQPHREAAFEACQFLMDWLKTKAPFWKLEEDGEGDGAKWVDARESDDKAAARWARQDSSR